MAPSTENLTTNNCRKQNEKIHQCNNTINGKNLQMFSTTWSIALNLATSKKERCLHPAFESTLSKNQLASANTVQSCMFRLLHGNHYCTSLLFQLFCLKVWRHLVRRTRCVPMLLYVVSKHHSSIQDIDYTKTRFYMFF